MKVTCQKCRLSFDDARRTTVCPHERIMSAEDLAQKDLALNLIGKDVRFNDEPDGPKHRVQTVGFTGMVTLHDMVGEFAPHLFVIAKAEQTTNG
jgi:hypothetical protein